MILADEQLTGATGPGGELLAGNVLWALTDHLGSVRDLVAFEDTNNDTIKDTAVIKNHIKYNAFGEIVSESDPTVEHIFGFTGRERDKESDLYYYRNRYYDPTTGRFLTADPIRDDFENSYRYAGNDPVNNVDPSGLMEKKAKLTQKQADQRVLMRLNNAISIYVHPAIKVLENYKAYSKEDVLAAARLFNLDDNQPTVYQDLANGTLSSANHQWLKNRVLSQYKGAKAIDLADLEAMLSSEWRMKFAGTKRWTAGKNLYSLAKR